MTRDESVRALASLGLTPRQTQFVATVALHGGYWLRRQYMASAGLQYGKAVRDFPERLVARGLAIRETCRPGRGFVYHLQARAIYRALDQQDNRNRRQASPAAIARKLMLLDFVLADPGAEWFATERDKVNLFTSRFGVPLEDLPQHAYAAYDQRSAETTRYFADKLPIWIPAGTTTVHFVALALEPSSRSFERFLLDHARLFSRLPDWSVVAVGPAHAANFDACQAIFDRTMHADQATASGDRAALVRYFTARQAVERNAVAALSVADLNAFRHARRRFATASVEALYARWIVAGERVWNAPGSVAGRFAAHVLPFTYSQFGDFAGVC